MNLKPFRKVLVGCAAALTAAGIAFGGMTSASAEPIGTPNVRELNGSGSDTTQDLVNGLSEKVQVGSVKVLGSFNAGAAGTPGQSDNINPRNITGNDFVRPNGSGDGVKALTASITGAPWKTKTITGQLDFARSSSGIVGPGTDLTYIPFAVDAVTYATAATSVVPSGIPLDHAVGTNGLSLKRIFTCESGSFDFGGKKYHTVGTPAGSIKLEPIQLQAGSGTRSFWEKTVGSGTCMTGNAQEHDGSALVGKPNALVPFSIAQWIAQTNSAANGGTIDGVPVAVRLNGAKLNDIGTSKPTVISGGKTVLNPVFTVRRDVYNVVQTSRLTSSAPADANLKAAFSGSSSLICTAQSDSVLTIQAFGFGKSPICGSTSLTSKYPTL